MSLAAGVSALQGFLLKVTAGLPLKISGYIIKPYAGIGFGVDDVNPNDAGGYEVYYEEEGVGLDWALGVHVIFKGLLGSLFRAGTGGFQLFLSAEYRQRFAPAVIEYHGRTDYGTADSFTETFFFGRFALCFGIVFESRNLFRALR